MQNFRGYKKLDEIIKRLDTFAKNAKVSKSDTLSGIKKMSFILSLIAGGAIGGAGVSNNEQVKEALNSFLVGDDYSVEDISNIDISDLENKNKEAIDSLIASIEGIGVFLKEIPQSNNIENKYYYSYPEGKDEESICEPTIIVLPPVEKVPLGKEKDKEELNVDVPLLIEEEGEDLKDFQEEEQMEIQGVVVEKEIVVKKIDTSLDVFYKGNGVFGIRVVFENVGNIIFDNPFIDLSSMLDKVDFKDNKNFFVFDSDLQVDKAMTRNIEFSFKDEPQKRINIGEEDYDILFFDKYLEDKKRWEDEKVKQEYEKRKREYNEKVLITGYLYSELRKHNGIIITRYLLKGKGGKIYALFNEGDDWIIAQKNVGRDVAIVGEFVNKGYGIRYKEILNIFK